MKQNLYESPLATSDATRNNQFYDLSYDEEDSEFL